MSAHRSEDRSVDQTRSGFDAEGWPEWLLLLASRAGQLCQGRWTYVIVALFAAGSVVMQAGSFFLFPTAPPTHRGSYMDWLNASMIATGDRLHRGAAVYQPDADGATHFEHVNDLVVPYFPGAALLSAGCSFVVPGLWSYWPRILGLIASVCLYLIVWRTARRIGTSDFTAAAVTLIAAGLIGVPTFWQPFHPDTVIGITGFLAGLLVSDLLATGKQGDRPPAIRGGAVLLVLLAAMAVFFKQTGIAVGGGCILASLVVCGVPRGRRGLIALASAIGVGTGAAGALSFPGAWEVCVLGMAEPLFPPRFFATHVLSHAMSVTFPMLAPVWVFLLHTRSSVPGASDAMLDGKRGPSAALVVVLLTMTAFQLLSSAKVGGGPWNLDLVAVLWIPISAWCLERVLAPPALRAMLLLGLLCGTANGLFGSLRNLEESRALRHAFPDIRRALGAEFSGRVAHVQTGEYLLARSSGLEIINGYRSRGPGALDDPRGVIVIEGGGDEGRFVARVQGQVPGVPVLSPKPDWEYREFRVFELLSREEKDDSIPGSSALLNACPQHQSQ